MQNVPSNEENDNIVKAKTILYIVKDEYIRKVNLKKKIFFFFSQTKKKIHFHPNVFAHAIKITHILRKKKTKDIKKRILYIVFKQS